MKNNFGYFIFPQVWDRRLVNTESPEAVGVFSGHRDGITYLDMKGDGRHFISNSKDQTIKLWDMRKFSNWNVVESRH